MPFLKYLNCGRRITLILQTHFASNLTVEMKTMSMQIYIQKSMHEETASLTMSHQTSLYGVCEQCGPMSQDAPVEPQMPDDREREGLLTQGFPLSPTLGTCHSPRASFQVQLGNFQVTLYIALAINTIITAFNPMTKCNRLFCFSFFQLAQLHGCLPFLHLAILSL